MKHYQSMVISGILGTSLDRTFFLLQSWLWLWLCSSSRTNSFPFISKPFALIANSSFSFGIFPKKLKFGKVTPVHKGKSKLELGNYGPISILPIFSKTLERVMNVRMVKCLSLNKIIFEHQYGFQEKNPHL